MKKPGTRIQIVFPDEHDRTPVNDLVDFLKEFKAIYSYCLKNQKKLEHIIPDSEMLATASSLPAHWGDILVDTSLSRGVINTYYKKHLGEEDLYIDKIIKRSPLSIELVCMSVGLLAVTISGGKFKRSVDGTTEFEIPSLGEGLQAIQKVFDQIEERKNRKKERARHNIEAEQIFTQNLIDTKRTSLIDKIEQLTNISNRAGIDPEIKEALINSIRNLSDELDRIGLL
jgi:hypothetical protein